MRLDDDLSSCNYITKSQRSIFDLIVTIEWRWFTFLQSILDVDLIEEDDLVVMPRSSTNFLFPFHCMSILWKSNWSEFFTTSSMNLLVKWCSTLISMSIEDYNQDFNEKFGKNCCFNFEIVERKVFDLTINLVNFIMVSSKLMLIFPNLSSFKKH